MSDSDSSGSNVNYGFWRNSPSPEAEDERDEEGKDWAFEIVGEEVDADGEVRYEVDWDGWERADGTTQTWQPMHHSLTSEWRRVQKRQRDAILKDSIDIELGPFSGVDLHNDGTRLRAQAYEEKLALRQRYSPKLEEQMAKLLAEKLGPGANLDGPPSPTSAAPATPAGRGLRLSTVRQQRQKSVTIQSQGPARGRDGASISRTPLSSSSKSVQAVSASSSGSSSRPRMFPSPQIDLPQSSQSMNSTATSTCVSQDSASRKRKVSALESAVESNDRAETEYREHRGVKRVRAIYPQRQDEVEGEDEEGGVDNEVAGFKQSATDLVEGGNGRFFDSEPRYVAGSDTGMESIAGSESESESSEKPATESVESRDGRFFDSESGYMEDSDAVDVAEDVAESRTGRGSQMADEPTTRSVAVGDIPNKEDEGKPGARSGRGMRLKTKYGERNPCDRCERDGVVCLSRNRGNACLRCRQQRQKCGLLTQSGSLLAKSRKKNAGTLQGPIPKHGSQLSEQQVALSTKVINAPVGLIEQLTKSVDGLSAHIQRLIALTKMNLDMQRVNLHLKPEKAPEVVVPEGLDRVVISKMPRHVDYKQYKLSQERQDLQQASGVVESEKATKFGGHPVFTLDHPDFSSVGDDLASASQKSVTGQKKKVVEKLAEERRRKAEQRDSRKAQKEKNRIRKGKGKVMEDEEDKSE